MPINDELPDELEDYDDNPTASGTDLVVSEPDEVPGVLRAAAEIYYEFESELSSAWQDPGAGKIWGRIARILDQAADRIERLL